ncbi:hypothetical protein QU755_17650 [Pseudomonas wenzhouensis]|nr:hypothetical protein [Pseudomonas wenzhouensis]MDM9653239.1 hypothetical protein [Pseudomonas wenzhouensis]
MNQEEFPTPGVIQSITSKYGLTPGEDTLDDLDIIDIDGLTRVINADFSRRDYILAAGVEMFLTPAMGDESVSQRVWSKWYGSRKAAEKVEAALLTVNDPKVSKLAKKKLKHFPPLHLLNIVFGSRGGMSMAQESLGPEQFFALSPMRRLDVVLQDLFERYLELEDPILSLLRDDEADIVEVAKAVESAWPFMAQLHDYGVFRFSNSRSLLLVDRLCAMIETGMASQQDIPLIQVAIGQILGSILPRLEAIAAITRPAVASSYCINFMFAGLTAKNYDPSVSFWAQVEPESLKETLSQITLTSEFMGGQNNAGHFEALIDSISAQVVKSASISRLISSTLLNLQQEEIGKSLYSRLRTQMNEASHRYDGCPSIDGSPFFPEDLVSRVLDVGDAERPWAALPYMRTLRHELHEIAVALSKVEQRNHETEAGIKEVQEQIKDLAADPSLSNLKKIAELSERAGQLIEKSQAWYLNEFSPLVYEYGAAWHLFWESVEKLPRKGHAAPDIQAPVEDGVESNDHAECVECKELAEMKELLLIAQADNDHLKREIEDIRSSAHRIRTQLANSNDPQREFIPQDVTGAVARLVARKNCSPLDVLTYHAGVNSERVIILPSAISSAEEYQAPYDHIERMIEVMGNLVGPYLDELRSGKPDTVARNVLGGKTYAAKESDGAIQNARFRAEREFEYKGEKRLFVQHLRISNEKGAKGMRIYFCVDGEGRDKKIVVAYVGSHLSNFSTN